MPETATYYLPEMHSFATRMGIRFSPDVLFLPTRVHTIRAREEFRQVYQRMGGSDPLGGTDLP